MAVAIVETRAITGGVDTHADVHVAAALDPVGGLLGVREFPVTAAGYAGLLGWLAGFGTVCLVGIEGTGSYGAGLARHMSGRRRPGRRGRALRPAGPPPPGQIRPVRRGQRSTAAQSGRARGAPKGRDGAVEAIRALMAARRSAPGEHTQTINQARALIVTGPDDLRARFAAHATAALVTALASLRPRPGAVVGYPTRIALRELGRRAEFLDGQIACLDALIMPLVTGHAPCSPCTASAPTPPPCSWSPPGTTPKSAPLRSRLTLYRFRTRRRCCDLRFGRMSWLRQDRGLCPFDCST